MVFLSSQQQESRNFQVLFSRLLLVAGADPGWRCCKRVDGKDGSMCQGASGGGCVSVEKRVKAVRKRRRPREMGQIDARVSV